jgi:metal-responsive CopG/Arc/MetJ family transcriptional regulator
MAFFLAKQKIMKQSSPTKQKKRGWPATRGTSLVALRLPKEFATRIDAWAVDHGGVTRSEAIRQLVEQALARTPSRGRSQEASSKALVLASKQIDKLLDPSASDEERQQRKRRLLKGPKEFREMRD